LHVAIVRDISNAEMIYNAAKLVRILSRDLLIDLINSPGGVLLIVMCLSEYVCVLKQFP